LFRGRHRLLSACVISEAKSVDVPARFSEHKETRHRRRNTTVGRKAARQSRSTRSEGTNGSALLLIQACSDHDKPYLASSIMELPIPSSIVFFV
jgi:hypothetical protein